MHHLTPDLTTGLRFSAILLLVLGLTSHPQLDQGSSLAKQWVLPYRATFTWPQILWRGLYVLLCHIGSGLKWSSEPKYSKGGKLPKPSCHIWTSFNISQMPTWPQIRPGRRQTSTIISTGSGLKGATTGNTIIIVLFPNHGANWLSVEIYYYNSTNK